MMQQSAVHLCRETVKGRAAVIAQPAHMEMARTVFRVPVADEVRVQLEGCGVCASNVPVWEGQPWFRYPLEPGAPGHEAWGYVDAIGPDVNNVRVGDRVAVLSSHAYAEYDLCRASELVKIPDEMHSMPFPGEPLGCAMNIFKRSAIKPGQTVAIVGVGFLGALMTQLATNAGAMVLAVSRRQEPLAIARQFGASETIQSADPEQVKRMISEVTFGRGCDCVIEVAGKQSSLDLATELTCERGRLVIAGYHQDGPRQVNMQLWNWRGLDVVNAHERDTAVYVQGMKDAINAIVYGRLDPSPLYTHRFALDQLSDAFNAITERPGDFMKGLLIL